MSEPLLCQHSDSIQMKMGLNSSRCTVDGVNVGVSLRYPHEEEL